MKATVNDIDIFYRERGAGPSILFIHGFPLDGALWRPQMDALADEYHVIVPDLRGFGQSTPTKNATLEQHADDLHALMNALDVSHVVLAGLSMGGYVAFAFYRKYPDRVLGLALVDTRAQPDTAEGRANREATALRVKKHGAGILADDLLENLLSPTTLQNAPDVAATVHEMIERQPVEGLVAALQGMAQCPDSRPLLAEIAEPTLVVVGADDTITPLADAKAMTDAIPGAELALIPQAGHLPNLEQPDTFNRILRDFITQRIEVT